VKLTALKPANLARAIKPAFTENIGLKLFSLGCALVLYSFVHGSQDAQRIMAVDLVVLLPPASENRTLITELPTSVRVSLHGPRSLVAELRPSDLGNVQLDLRAGHIGRVLLEPGMLSIPGGVKLDSIEPPALDIVWDDVVERDITVQVPITGEPAEGFAVRGRAAPTPTMLRARGPSQVVENLQLARTEAFDVTGLKEGMHRRMLAIDRPAPRVTYDVMNATATIEIARRLLERTFGKVRVQVVGLPRAQALPQRVDVRVVGPPELINALRPEQIVPRVRLQDEELGRKRSNSLLLPVEMDIDNAQVSIIPKDVVVKW
jgi:hypothetical protein